MENGGSRAYRAGWRIASLILLASALVIGANLLSPGSRGRSSSDPSVRGRALANYSTMPLYFERNIGQSDSSVRYLAHTSRYSLFLTDDSTVVTIVGGSIRKNSPTAKVLAKSAGLVESAVRIRLVGANPHPAFEALDPLAGRVNYLVGNDPSKFRRDVPIFARVKMQNVYPGIDLVYYGTPKSFEYDLVAAPGADTSKLKFAVEGPARTTVDKNGNLIIATRAGVIMWQKPRIYQQDASGGETPVSGTFALARDGTIDAGVPRRDVSFDLASYDRARTLVIDPSVQVVYSTYLGGSGSSVGPINLEQFSAIAGGTLPLDFADAGTDVALDSSNDAYVTGVAFSNNFPTKSAFQATLAGANSPPDQNPNAFVSKFDYSQSGAASLIYSTYIGGSGDTVVDDAGDGNGDLAFGIAADASGQAYIVGQTYSANFPSTTTCGAFGQTNPQGGTATNVGFVAKLAAAGTSLVYSCYIDGTNNATESRVALFPGGCGTSTCKAYVSGSTQSDMTSGFPVTSGAFQKTLAATGGKSNATFLVVHQDGQSLDYATLYGGAGNGTNADVGLAVAVDGTSGNGFITGGTFSNNLTVPGAQVAAYGGTANHTSNAFVAEFNPTLSGVSSLVYGTYLGGSGAVGTITGGPTIAQGDAGTAITIDANHHVWVTGFTASTNFQVPGLATPSFQTTNQANTVSGAPATVLFITQLDPATSGASGILYSTYFGGNGTKVAPDDLGSIGFGDAGTGIVFSGGRVYVTGLTTSGATANSFPISTGACGALNTSSGFAFGDFATVPLTAFVAELDPTQAVAANQLVFSTFVGGSGMADGAGGLKLDSDGNIVVAGFTYSPDFPVTPNAFQLSNNAPIDKDVDESQAFLTVLNPVGTVCPTPFVTPTPTASPSGTPTATPTPVGNVQLIEPGSGGGGPGASVGAGSFSYTPSDILAQTLTSVSVTVSKPNVFSSLVLTASLNGTSAGSSTVNAPNILDTTVFTFSPPISIPAGGSQVLTFTLNGVISGGASAQLGFDHSRIKLAGIVSAGSRASGDHAGLLIALSMLGFVIVPMRRRQRQRIAIAAFAIVAMAAALAGCGGSSGGPPAVSTSSSQQVVALNITEGVNPVPVSGLPVDLGTVTKH